LRGYQAKNALDAFGSIDISIPINQSIDFSPVCEKPYQGLRESLIERANKMPAIGHNRRFAK
jgi:hypothetical protein